MLRPAPSTPTGSTPDTGPAPAADEQPTSPAHTRQRNAHRAAHAAQALQLHGRVSHSHAEGMQQALIELLTDIHHLCDTCDLDPAPLYEAAALIHAQETRAA
ncbi:hypothetical protein [Kineococcus aurantiacus]|uniref:Uncharacterized protein n=1 Tax=Kineococcus aurantiacus TaxID=37633 RepID=A0A7Y9DQ62_9ACTN|nr:hypothetical protein [Kineococcus aurantiacus]NYD24776.1 hypothetical protein [Kineococcus aurantiacus]